MAEKAIAAVNADTGPLAEPLATAAKGVAVKPLFGAGQKCVVGNIGEKELITSSNC
jgi:hypothetical protein